MLDEEIVQK